MARKSSFGTLSNQQMLGGGVIVIVVVLFLLMKKKSEFGVNNTFTSLPKGGVNIAVWTVTNDQQINCITDCTPIPNSNPLTIKNTVILTDDPGYGTAYMYNAPSVKSAHGVWTIYDDGGVVLIQNKGPDGSQEALWPYICNTGFGCFSYFTTGKNIPVYNTDIGIGTRSNPDYNYLIQWSYNGDIYIGMSNFINGVANVVWQQKIGPVSTTKTVSYGFNILEGPQLVHDCDSKMNLVWWIASYNLFYFINQGNPIFIINNRQTPGGSYSGTKISQYLGSHVCSPSNCTIQ